MGGVSENTAERLRGRVGEIYRSDSRRVFATLIRLLGDFDLAEDAMHNAFAAALEQWPKNGLPANLRAWLVSAGRFKAIDALRRRARFEAALGDLADRLDAGDGDPAARDGDPGGDRGGARAGADRRRDRLGPDCRPLRRAGAGGPIPVVELNRAVIVAMRLLPVWKGLKAAANTLPYEAAIMGDFSLPAGRAASVPVPTLVAGGEKSDPRLRHAIRELADALPNARHRVLEGQGHTVSMKALAPALAEFFATRNGSRLGTQSNA